MQNTAGYYSLGPRLKARARWRKHFTYVGVLLHARQQPDLQRLSVLYCQHSLWLLQSFLCQQPSLHLFGCHLHVKHQLLPRHCVCHQNNTVLLHPVMLDIWSNSCDLALMCMFAGYRFLQQGIKSCGLNTSAPVGTTFNVTFMVFDYSIPSLNASVTRTVSIINPCSFGQQLCSDGTCSDIQCSLR